MAEMNGNEATSPLTLAHATELLLRHTARMNAEQYRIGRICNEVVGQSLTGRPSYGSAELYFCPRIKELSPSDLRRAYTVARAFTEEACVKYGVRRLNLLVEYAVKFQIPWTEGEPGPTPILVPCEDGPLWCKPFAECTEEELGLAIAREPPRNPEPAPRVDARCVQLLRDGIQKRFARHSFARVYAIIRRGRIHVTLKNISVTELEMLVGAILESLEPLHEEMYRRPLAQHRGRSAS
jgi:hypothetical protein